jgi:hypothetical protein
LGKWRAFLFWNLEFSITSKETRPPGREPLEKLALEGQLVVYKHQGFWQRALMPRITLNKVQSDSSFLKEYGRQNEKNLQSLWVRQAHSCSVFRRAICN